MSAPDLQGEVLGWRDWQVTAYGDLTSRNTHAVWRPGPMRAICSFGAERDHAAPQEDCACGFYGLHSQTGLMPCHPPEGADYPGPIPITLGGASSTNATVRGLFAAWGRICVHADGFRAEWVELVCLVHPNPSPPVLRASGYYDVPLFATEEEAEAYALDKGYGFVPEEMRPEHEEPEESEYTLNFATGGLVAWGAGSAYTIPSSSIAPPEVEPEGPTPRLPVRWALGVLCGAAFGAIYWAGYGPWVGVASMAFWTAVATSLWAPPIWRFFRWIGCGLAIRHVVDVPFGKRCARCGHPSRDNYHYDATPWERIRGKRLRGESS